MIVALVTAPVDIPSVAAISHSVVTALVFWSSQLLRVAVWFSPIRSLTVLTPVVIATALGAESVI
ncbi:hypothetical protein D3C79_1022520 [compost metagenome]